MHVPPCCRRQADRDAIQLETPRDIARDVGNRPLAVGGQQDVAAQIEQPGHLLFAGLGFARPLPGGCRQLAGDDGHGHEDEQRHPVLGIGDRERVERRQQEKVEREHRRHRDANRHAQVRRGRRRQHDQQEQQRRNGRVRLVLNTLAAGAITAIMAASPATVTRASRRHCAVIATTVLRVTAAPNHPALRSAEAPGTFPSTARPWVRLGYTRWCDSVN